jgi:hypothetical protein
MAAKDLIHENATSTGTGNFTTTAVNGKVQFGAATIGFGTGSTTNVFDYYISNRDAAEWERGTGHCPALGTLVRDTVLASSNANALVNFSAGTKDITNDIPAAQQLRGSGGGTDNAALRADGAGNDVQGSALIIADTTGALSRSGGGGIPIQGTNTNNRAAAGDVGEVISSFVSSSPGVTLVASTPTTIASITLTPGEWDVTGPIHYVWASATVQHMISGIGTAGNIRSIATLGEQSEGYQTGLNNIALNGTYDCNPPLQRVQITGASVQYYLIAQAGYSAGSCVGWGYLRARRVR